MYDSDLNPWNAVKMGPKKDIIGLLKKATEKEGLIFGLSSHRLENFWFYNGGMEFPSDVQDKSVSLYGRRLEQEKYTDEKSNTYIRLGRRRSTCRQRRLTSMAILAWISIRKARDMAGM